VKPSASVARDKVPPAVALVLGLNTLPYNFREHNFPEHMLEQDMELMLQALSTLLNNREVIP